MVRVVHRGASHQTGYGSNVRNAGGGVIMSKEKLTGGIGAWLVVTPCFQPLRSHGTGAATAPRLGAQYYGKTSGQVAEVISSFWGAGRAQG